MENLQNEKLQPVFVYVEGFQYSLQSEIAKTFDLYFNKILKKKVKIIDFVNFKKQKDMPRDMSIIFRTASYIYDWADIIENLPPSFDVYVFVNSPISLLHYLHYTEENDEHEIKRIKALKGLCRSVIQTLPSPDIVINHAGYPLDKHVFPIWRISRYNYLNSYKKIKPYLKSMFLPAIRMKKLFDQRVKQQPKDFPPHAKWLEDFYDSSNCVILMVGLDFLEFDKIPEPDILAAKHMKFLDKKVDTDDLLLSRLQNKTITYKAMKEFLDKHFNQLIFPILQKDNEKKKHWKNRNERKRVTEKKKRRGKRKEKAQALLKKLEEEMIEEEKEKEKEKEKPKENQKKKKRKKKEN